jgi:ribosomal protein L11 methyltransferase
VFDFGTGTGVLAILAAKMGAERIIAVDNDDWSMANATENIERNHCSGISLQKKTSPDGEGRFDLILANINRNVVQENLDALEQHLAADGVLLSSGLLVNDRPAILAAAGGLGLELKAEYERAGWICLMMGRQV